MSKLDDEHLSEIIEMISKSHHFEYKIRSWTHKMIKEIFSEYWKIFITVSSVFIFVVLGLIGIIFNSFNSAIHKIETTLTTVSATTIALDNTINLLVIKKLK